MSSVFRQNRTSVRRFPFVPFPGRPSPLLFYHKPQLRSTTEDKWLLIINSQVVVTIQKYPSLNSSSETNALDHRQDLTQSTSFPTWCPTASPRISQHLQQTRTSDATSLPPTRKIFKHQQKPHCYTGFAGGICSTDTVSIFFSNGGETCTSHEVHVVKRPSHTWPYVSTCSRRTHAQKESALFCKHWNKTYAAVVGRGTFRPFFNGSSWQNNF